MTGEVVRGDHDILTRALHAAEARCAQLQAELAETRDERDGFAKTCLEQKTEIERLKANATKDWQRQEGMRTIADQRDSDLFYAYEDAEELRGEVARLRALINGLECDYMHHDEDGQGERGISCIDNMGSRMCRICMAKVKVEDADK